jgi:hypothetical protein
MADARLHGTVWTFQELLKFLINVRAGSSVAQAACNWLQSGDRNAAKPSQNQEVCQILAQKRVL